MMKVAAKMEEADGVDVNKEKMLEDDGAKKESELKDHTNGVAEEASDASAKRAREMDNGGENDDLDSTPPMYRQARGLFLQPEVCVTLRCIGNAEGYSNVALVAPPSSLYLNW